MPTKEYKWLVDHPDVVARYPDEYVAIVGEAVAAHGKDLETVFTEASKKGEPLIHKVRAADKDVC